MSTEQPTFSIVMEWENARLSELGRTREMLRRLHEQLLEVGGPRPEIVILHNEEHVGRRLVEEVVGEVAAFDAWPADVRIVATEGLEYFEQKNFGARQSDSDLVIFLDSDVVPEQGWLAALLEPFHDSAVRVVCGNTYMSPEGLYGKAFALFWFFPLRAQEDDLIRTDRYLWGNNVAFRREIFEQFGYPELQSFRGQGVALRRLLREHGVDIFLQQKARVSHPSPNGLRHFVNRALCHGYDLVADHPRRKNTPVVFARSVVSYLYSLGRSLGRIAMHHRDVQLGPAGAVGAFGIAAGYHTLRFAGALLTIVRPELVPRRFPI